MKNRTWLITAFLGLILLLLQGCKAVGPDFTPPEVRTPETFRYAAPGAQGAQDLKWWEMFDDPILSDLVRTALENNLELKSAASRIEEARAAYGYTKADQYPRVDLEAGGSAGNFSGARSRYDNKNAYIAPMLSWELDFWGKFKRSTTAAQADLLASEYGTRAIQINLVADVAASYYQLLDYHQRLKISKVTLASRMDGLNIIRQRFEQGTIPEIDLNQAQIQKEIAAGSIPRYERQIAKTEHVLNILLGQLPQSIQTVATLDGSALPPFIPLAMPASLLERRPEIQQSLALLHAQSERIGVAVARQFPAISLTAGLGLASSELSLVTNQGGIWTAGAGLLTPLFDYGKNKRRVDIEEERTRQALFDYERTVLTAFSEVEDALVEVDTYKRQTEAAERKMAAAQNAAMLSFERYDKGVSSYLEVLDSERTQFNAELELSRIKRQLFNAYVKLYKSLGGGWLDESESATSDSPHTKS